MPDYSQIEASLQAVQNIDTEMALQEEAIEAAKRQLMKSWQKARELVETYERTRSEAAIAVIIERGEGWCTHHDHLVPADQLFALRSYKDSASTWTICSRCQFSLEFCYPDISLDPEPIWVQYLTTTELGSRNRNWRFKLNRDFGLPPSLLPESEQTYRSDRPVTRKYLAETLPQCEQVFAELAES